MFFYIKKIFDHKKRLPEVRLLTQRPSRGRVVLGYIFWPFKEGWNSPKARGHTNAFEVVTIAETYRKLGYAVDVIEYHNRTYVPPSDTCIAIDIEGQFERWDAYLPKTCKRITHATAAHWLLANQAELARLAAIRDRKGVVLRSRRHTHPPDNGGEDEIVVLGNKYTMNSFAFAKKPITRIPISSAYEFEWPQERNFTEKKKNFLWVASYGMVHKGLDLVLEAFAQMPELSLTICARPEKEPDFFRLYEKELLHTPNIHARGWVDMASLEFKEIARTHASTIYPSCSEGGGGSVIHCMHAGMVPLCTYEASVDLNDFGMLIKSGTVEAVMETARAFAALPDEEVQQRAKASYEHVRKVHTRDQFQKNYHEFAARVLKS
ncbi:MAG: glycosyltransferase [Verrucomicrobia bacterium]|nr:MAG: glycosyltransferase [Verrucomicrobiota bacterium]